MLRSKSKTNKKPCAGGCGLKIPKHGEPTCGLAECVEVFIKSDAIKKAIKRVEAEKRKKQRKQYREAKERVQAIGEAMDLCQRYAINPLINYLDRFKPCISCGKPINGRREAGHFLAKSASSGGTIVRFNYDNINTQCHKCNCYGWDKEAYRAEHGRRYGPDALTEVERIHRLGTVCKFKPTKDWVREIREKAKLDLKKAKADDSFIPENNHFITMKYL